MPPTRERLAKNEALFREVNARIRELSERWELDAPELISFVCECSQAGCSEPVELTLQEYEQVRTDPAHFFVVPGHEDGRVDDVVARHERYWVVAKKPAEASTGE
jgi:hypothetical protein